MEQDKQLKEVLAKVVEKASVNFTGTVMAGIHALAAKPFVYEPLIPAFLKRIFIAGFITVVGLILILCLFITSPGIDFTDNIRLPDISPEAYQQIIIGILIFWIVFAVNNWLVKIKWKLS
jgi:hypothetical protein